MKPAAALPPTLDELAADPARALTLSPDAALDALARWSSVERNLIVAASRTNGAGETIPDIDVDAREAARRLGISPKTLYRIKDLPFASRRGRKLVFSLRGLERWRREREGVR